MRCYFFNSIIYAVVNGKCVGKAKIEDLDKPSIYIPLVKIKKKYRRMGYGLMLLDYISNHYSSFESVSLYVSIYNPNAILFYRKAGFFISLYRGGEHPHYLMTKKYDR